MADSEQYTMTEPELQLYNEDKDENYSLPTFASMVARFSQKTLALQESLHKTFSMDTVSTMRESTDVSATSSESARVVKVADRCQCHLQESSDLKVEHSLAAFQCKLFLEDAKNRLEEPIIEENGGASSDDEFEDEKSSIISLNTLSTQEPEEWVPENCKWEKDETDRWIAENCKLSPTMGCVGLIQLGLSGYREKEGILDANDNLEQSSICTDQKFPEPPTVGGIYVVHEISFVDEVSSGYDDSESEISEITIVDFDEDEIWEFDPFAYGVDDSDDRHKLEQLAVVETESVTSDWGQKESEEDQDSHSTANTILGTSSESPIDETEPAKQRVVIETESVTSAWGQKQIEQDEDSHSTTDAISGTCSESRIDETESAVLSTLLR